jgi:hypothetical protein
VDEARKGDKYFADLLEEICVPERKISTVAAWLVP